MSADFRPFSCLACGDRQAYGRRGVTGCLSPDGLAAARVSPGCVATGPTLEVALARMRNAIAMHLAGLREDGLPVPPPASDSAWLEVAA